MCVVLWMLMDVVRGRWGECPFGLIALDCRSNCISCAGEAIRCDKRGAPPEGGCVLGMWGVEEVPWGVCGAMEVVGGRWGECPFGLIALDCRSNCISRAG